MRYDDFDLLIMQKGADGYPTRVISASAGEAQGVFDFNSTSDGVSMPSPGSAMEIPMRRCSLIWGGPSFNTYSATK